MRNCRQYDIEEVVVQAGVDEAVIIEYIRNEWIIPSEAQKLLFDDEDIARLRLIFQLKGIFGVNDEGIPLILHLIDQLNSLQYQIKTRAGSRTEL